MEIEGCEKLMLPEINEFLAEMEEGTLESLMSRHSAERLTPTMDINEIAIQLNHGSMLFTLDMLCLYHTWITNKLEQEQTNQK
ncbi:hypothetical protein EDD63_13610 [Breznakia blatticola]|uniref:Uncharacterized protein n=2 Tax=Breznakia blatticola TaxID=1754012 RepID=A0A4R7ZAX9_9FIRM|nr:hypothetical protein EDD63_13610 [Breznakia blatticola]